MTSECQGCEDADGIFSGNVKVATTALELHWAEVKVVRVDRSADGRRKQFEPHVAGVI